MDYKEAWKSIKTTLQIGLLVSDSRLIDFDDDGAVEMARPSSRRWKRAKRPLKRRRTKGDPTRRTARDGCNEWGLIYTSSIPQEVWHVEF